MGLAAILALQVAVFSLVLTILAPSIALMTAGVVSAVKS